MFKKVAVVFVLFFCSLLLSGCALKKSPAAIQVDSTPEANVFIDGKLLGKTPFTADNLKAGEVVVKLIPESTTETFPSWEGKVKMVGGVLTLVSREFASSESNSSGQILSLEKTKDKEIALISIVTDPDGVAVTIDNEDKGKSPVNIEKLPAGDHEISFNKENYRGKTIRVKSIAGYRLIVNVKLGQGGLVSSLNPTPTPTFSGPTPKVTVTPRLGAKTTPSPVPTKATGTGLENSFVLIKENSLGFLRIRNAPSGSEIAQIKPIDPEQKYPLVEEKSGWYKITYGEGKEGWVTADTTYTTKITE